MAEKFYKVRLLNEEKGIDETIDVSENEYILDIAEIKGLDMPYSCRTGVCVNCAGKLKIKEGQKIEKEIQKQLLHDYDFLKQKELDAGFLLTCRAKPLSDCTILTHQEDSLLEL